jgi:hypothetical protein
MTETAASSHVTYIKGVRLSDKAAAAAALQLSPSVARTRAAPRCRTIAQSKLYLRALGLTPLCQAKKPLNRTGDSSVYRTVCWIDR